MLQTCFLTKKLFFHPNFKTLIIYTLRAVSETCATPKHVSNGRSVPLWKIYHSETCFRLALCKRCQIESRKHESFFGKNEKEYSWHVPHEIYRDAVGLKSCKNTWNKRYLWKREIWVNIVKIWYFVNNWLIKAWI